MHALVCDAHSSKVGESSLSSRFSYWNDSIFFISWQLNGSIDCSFNKCGDFEISIGIVSSPTDYRWSMGLGWRKYNRLDLIKTNLELILSCSGQICEICHWVERNLIKIIPWEWSWFYCLQFYCENALRVLRLHSHSQAWPIWICMRFCICVEHRRSASLFSHSKRTISN